MTAIVKLKVAWFVMREVGVSLNICTVAWLEREDNSLASSFSFVNHHYNTNSRVIPSHATHMTNVLSNDYETQKQW